MIKCPFCQYDNEDGALFCEQCKSDLGVLETGTEAPPLAVPVLSEAPPVELAKESRFPDMPLAVPVASPVDMADISAVPLLGPIPVARPLGRDNEGEEGRQSATCTESGKGSLGPTDTVDSVKTFVSPSGGRKARDAESTQEAHARLSDRPVARDTDVLPTGGKPRLLVLRGQKINVEYPIYDGDNFIGRADEKPVDIDLEDQEPPDRIWSSRQHALIRFEEGVLAIEDLNSSNGTFINRTRLYPGQKRVLNMNDVIQIGTVQMKVVSQ